MEDGALAETLGRDRAAGMELLLRKYGPLLRYVIRGILPNPQDAEDCFSEVSLLLWQKLDGYDPGRGGLPAWLTAVARNAALNCRRAALRREVPLSDREPEEPETPEGALLRRERAERLRGAVEALSPKERRLFYRKYYYCQSTAQIAAETGRSERAVEGRLYRLRQKLKSALGGDVL